MVVHDYVRVKYQLITISKHVHYTYNHIHIYNVQCTMYNEHCIYVYGYNPDVVYK